MNGGKVFYYDGTSKKDLGIGSNPQLFKDGVLYFENISGTSKLFYYDGQNSRVVSEAVVINPSLFPRVFLDKGLVLWKQQNGQVALFDGKTVKELDGTNYYSYTVGRSGFTFSPQILDISADRIVFSTVQDSRIPVDATLNVLYTDPTKKSISVPINSRQPLTSNVAISPDYVYGRVDISSTSSLARYDGTNTTLVSNVVPYQNLLTVGNDLYFTQADSNNIQQVYKYTENTLTAISQNKSATHQITPRLSNGKVIFVANDGNDTEVYSYDGQRLIQITDNTINDNAQSPIVSKDGSLYYWSEDTGSGNYQSTLYNVVKNQFAKFSPIDLGLNNPPFADTIDQSVSFDDQNNLSYLGAKLTLSESKTSSLNILGTTGDDILFGSIDKDTLVGDDGNDQIFGRAGSDSLYGGNGNDIIDGEDGNDMVFGGNSNDSLYGGNGNDIIYGESGDNYINGGDGNDILGGGSGADFLFGDTGNDTLYGGKSFDSLFGGIGEDLLRGEDDNDFLGGDDGNDTLSGGSGTDSLYGGNGNDNLNGDFGNDFLLGEAGDDQLFGSLADDTLFGGIGADSLVGEFGSDVLDGEDGNDSLYGGDENDYLYGANGDDSLSGEAGNDFLNGGNGNDFLRGGSGTDTLEGAFDNDILDGEDGNDRLIGNSGDDSLYGANGDDTLLGDDGADYLNGDNGFDILTGGAGSDIFAGFSPNAVNKDTITDFQVGIDKIALSKASFSALQSLVGNGFSVAADFAVVNNASLIATSTALVVYNSQDGTLTYNQNLDAAGLGTGGTFAKLDNLPTGLSASDFLIGN